MEWNTADRSYLGVDRSYLGAIATVHVFLPQFQLEDELFSEEGRDVMVAKSVRDYRGVSMGRNVSRGPLPTTEQRRVSPF
jgi:hypothetical protein